jgi:hypothetical protein
MGRAAALRTSKLDREYWASGSGGEKWQRSADAYGVHAALQDGFYLADL